MPALAIPRPSSRAAVVRDIVGKLAYASRGMTVGMYNGTDQALLDPRARLP